MDLAAEGSAVRDQAIWWLVNRSEGEWASFDLKPELEKRGLIEKPVALIKVTVPEKPKNTQFTVADVMALKGDATRGKVVASRGIVEPSFDISHGFEGTAVQLKDGKWIAGRIIADGNPVVITSTGGFTQKVPKKQIAGRKDMDRSLMLNADQLGMSAQDVADVVEWMKTY